MAENSSQNTTKLSGINLIQQPKYAWKCQLIPGTHWMVEEGKQPSWFWRKMQNLCFGIEWTKL